MGFVRKLKSSRSVAARQRSRKLSKAKSLPSDPPAIDDDVGSGIACRSMSLATGSFSSAGVFSIIQSAYDRSESPDSNRTEESVGSFSDGYSSNEEQRNKQSLQDVSLPNLSPIKELSLPRMSSRVFIRTADLPHMKEAVNQSRNSSFSELGENELIDHVHKPSSHPPLPDMDHDTNELWVALDDGNGSRAPLASAAMSSLVKTACDASMDQGMWTANGATAKLLKSGVWDDTVFVSYDEQRPVPVPHAKGSKGETDVLVWSGSWAHKFFGHDLPAIRCEAIVNMSPRALADLLIDSTRVKEYNKMSIGRDDIMVLHEDEKSVTKISVARTKPPMLGKTLVLKNLLHMEELPGGGEQAGYTIISRAVAHADDAEAEADPKVVHSEMLMGLNVIRAVEGEPDRCVLINLNHLRSPMIPMMFAKKLGLSSAVNFINDIRALC
ncbi:hypothetical protein ACHAXT_007529 [Thalassiosira profunda]